MKRNLKNICMLMGMVWWKEGIDEAGDGGENKSRSA